MAAVICGSVAYDNIMGFDGKFGEYILPDQLDILSVAFTVDLRKEFGGCAGNIAYNLKLLGDEPLIVATVGNDFDVYEAWFKKNKIDTRCIKIIPEKLTAQCFITTDSDNNQLTSFHPGAMEDGHLNTIPDHAEITIGILAPASTKGTLEHADQLVKKSIPFIFDPGQSTPMFNKDELNQLIDLSNWIIVNQYEANLLSDKVEKSIQDISNQVEAMIVTKSGEGSEMFVGEEVIAVSPYKAERVCDPTGCGDAYRAALLYGIPRSMSWDEMGQMGSLMGAIKVAQYGTQNHQFTYESLQQELQDSS